MWGKFLPCVPLQMFVDDSHPYVTTYRVYSRTHTRCTEVPYGTGYVPLYVRTVLPSMAGAPTYCVMGCVARTPPLLDTHPQGFYTHTPPIRTPLRYMQYVCTSVREYGVLSVTTVINYVQGESSVP